MATDGFYVTMPDGGAQKGPFPSSLTPEEIRSALVASGFTAVQNAEMIVSGTQITFRRVTGGTKGL